MSLTAESCFAFERSDHAGRWTQPVHYFASGNSRPEAPHDEVLLAPDATARHYLTGKRDYSVVERFQASRRWPVLGSILCTQLIFCTGHATFGWSGSEWPPEQLKGKAMGTVDILSLIKLGNLSDQQKAHLKDKLAERKRDLEAAMKRVDQGLALLSKKSKAKKRAKRRKSKR